MEVELTLKVLTFDSIGALHFEKVAEGNLINMYCSLPGL
jgi:hypothetical protein